MAIQNIDNLKPEPENPGPKVVKSKVPEMITPQNREERRKKGR